MELTSTNTNINVNQLMTEMEPYGIKSVSIGDTQTSCFLVAEITGQDLTDAQAALDSHAPNQTAIFVNNTVKENLDFALDLMQRMKQKNILEGLSSIDQAAWMHHRMRKVGYTLSDATTVVQIDLMNLVISGDIETAEAVLSQMVPDDMTQPHHWLNQARIDWIRNEIRSYLGWPSI